MYANRYNRAARDGSAAGPPLSSADAEGTQQLRLLPPRSPEDLIVEAKALWQPLTTVCMLSGGNDSMAVAHRCREHYDTLFHINTGTAVEEGPRLSVAAHVRRAADWLDKPLVVLSAGDAYEQMVLGGHRFVRGERAGEIEEGHGFPGPGMHGKAYARLKERQIEELLRRAKRGQDRDTSVLLISGVRRFESRRRAKRMPLSERGSAKYVSPLIDWTAHDLARYRREHRLPESDVAALMHRLGECNCGAFAHAAAERAMLAGLFPRTFARIRDLEDRAEAAGLRWCRWGGYDLQGVRSTEASGEQRSLACSDCGRQPELALAA
jgi:3'-phosphoadenosine 5'-phosphosulfate sulfotransferase (PAPS reductase)/FAD synthetase